MDDQLLAEEFDQHRARLRAVAQRMLGSVNEADDAVQEAWLRLSRQDPGSIDNLGGWLTTVMSRVCLDLLRSRTSRREDTIDADLSLVDTTSPQPEAEAQLADSLGSALLVDGVAGATRSVAGETKVVFDFTVVDGRVVRIEMVADPETIGVLDLEPAD